MNKSVVVALVGLVGAAAALVVAAVWIVSSVRDPGETIGLDDFDPLPSFIEVLVDATLPCRGSGRSGFLFRDLALRVTSDQVPTQILSLWLLGQGLTIDGTDRSGILRFADDDRIAEVWSFEDYEQGARPKSQAILTMPETPAVVLRLWPATICEV